MKKLVAMVLLYLIFLSGCVMKKYDSFEQSLFYQFESVYEISKTGITKNHTILNTYLFQSREEYEYGDGALYKIIFKIHHDIYSNKKVAFKEFINLCLEHHYIILYDNEIFYLDENCEACHYPYIYLDLYKAVKGISDRKQHVLIIKNSGFYDY